MTARALLRKPSGFMPLVMSTLAVGLLATAWFTNGLVHQPDEGGYAHLWQLLMGLQLPIVAYFGVRWAPQAPGPAARVLGLQLPGGVPRVLLPALTPEAYASHRRAPRLGRLAPLRVFGERPRYFPAAGRNPRTHASAGATLPT